ncbi:LysR substrate binding domain protein [compost metagenome]
MIEAALAGRGYALVRQSLIERELAAGRLHRVPASVMNSPLAYYLVYRPDALRDPELQLFRAWLLACAGKA